MGGEIRVVAEGVIVPQGKKSRRSEYGGILRKYEMRVGAVQENIWSQNIRYIFA
jgi:hypothetical protein